MPMFKDRLAHAWNAFKNPEEKLKRNDEYWKYGGYSSNPMRPYRYTANDRSMVMSIYNRIANDVAAIDIRHVQLDKNGRYMTDMKSYLNECLTVSANIDQSARAFRIDAALSLIDEGCIAIVPVDTTESPVDVGSYDIQTLRVGKVTEWFPTMVSVKIYNDRKGAFQTVTLPKNMVAIVENPFYSVMNEPNSTLQRLIRKLNLLDVIDEQSGAGKLDIIIQLPYTIRSKDREEQAEARRKSIEMQLSGSKYGIAYADATEHITQLNRPAENNLMSQIEYLTSMLYGQLGLSDDIIKGTADEQAMLNYQNRTIEPLVSAITDAMNRTFLTKTARTKGQKIMFFTDPFKLVPVNNMAEIADKFTRNEILTSNEVRQIIGLKPSTDPRADELRNKNLNASNDEIKARNEPEKEVQEGTEKTDIGGE